MSSNEQEPVAAVAEESQPRKGFALVTALLALVVVGALVTGSFYAASQEREMGLSARFNDDGLYVAENAMSQIVGDKPASFWTAITVPTKLDSVIVSAGGTKIGTAQIWVRPTGNGYFMVARGAPSRGGKSAGGGRTLGMVLRLLNISFPPGTAMQVYGDTHVQGSALISGKDTKPATGSQWNSCVLRTGTDTAIIAKDVSLVTVQKASSIVGPIVQKSSMTADNFLDYGDVDYDMLKALADKKYLGTDPGNPLPSGTATTCDRSVKDNWGEPYNSVPGCANYFPIIYVDHTLKLAANGRGQGILLVDGDLELTGGFEFWGVTVVKGALNMHGSGGHVNGVVLAYQEGQLNYDENLAIGNSLVQYSGCAVKRATENMGGNRAIPVRMHSWFDLSAAGANADF